MKNFMRSTAIKKNITRCVPVVISVRIVVLLLMVFSLGEFADLGAQSPYPPDPVYRTTPAPSFFDQPQPLRIRDYSWIYIDPPTPRVIKVHDIVTIIVDEKSEVTLNTRFNRTRNNSIEAEIAEFVRIGPEGNLENAAASSPKIDASLQGRIQNTGQVTDQEGIRYRIAATVVDVLPNGNLVLEARKMIRSNKDVWEYSLTGVIRSDDVNRDNTALSENIANLNIVKKQSGKAYDSTKRRWGITLMDWLSPF